MKKPRQYKLEKLFLKISAVELMAQFYCSIAILSCMWLKSHGNNQFILQKLMKFAC